MNFTQEDLKAVQEQFASQWEQFWQEILEGKK
jgi:hypothetical protein